MLKRLTMFAATTILLMSAGIANAAHITVFSAFIDGQQANMGMGTGSNGLGSATMTFDSDTNEFTWFVAWQNLMGDVIAAHFHGPAAPGMNAGVEVGIDHTMNPSSGSEILTAQQRDDLFAGLWYINIHTTVVQGGEIRGQVLRVVPIPAAVWLLLSAIGGLGVLGRRAGT